MPSMPEGLKTVGTIIGGGQVKEVWNNKLTTVKVLTVIAIFVAIAKIVWDHAVPLHAKEFLSRLWNDKVNLDNPITKLSLTGGQMTMIVAGGAAGAAWFTWGYYVKYVQQEMAVNFHTRIMMRPFDDNLDTSKMKTDGNVATQTKKGAVKSPVRGVQKNSVDRLTEGLSKIQQQYAALRSDFPQLSRKEFNKRVAELEKLMAFIRKQSASAVSARNPAAIDPTVKEECDRINETLNLIQTDIDWMKNIQLDPELVAMDAYQDEAEGMFARFEQEGAQAQLLQSTQRDASPIAWNAVSGGYWTRNA